jgi:hypothetical protein
LVNGRYLELKFSFFASGQSNYGLGRLHPEAGFDQGCIAVLLLGAVEIKGITTPADTQALAGQMNTSVSMLERHYPH